MAGQGVFIQRLIVDEDLWRETDPQSMYKEKIITIKPLRISSSIALPPML